MEKDNKKKLMELYTYIYEELIADTGYFPETAGEMEQGLLKCISTLDSIKIHELAQNAFKNDEPSYSLEKFSKQNIVKYIAKEIDSILIGTEYDKINIGIYQDFIFSDSTESMKQNTILDGCLVEFDPRLKEGHTCTWVVIYNNKSHCPESYVLIDIEACSAYIKYFGD